MPLEEQMKIDIVTQWAPRSNGNWPTFVLFRQKPKKKKSRKEIMEYKLYTKLISIICFTTLMTIFIQGCTKNDVKENVNQIKVALGGSIPTSIDPSNFASNDPVSGNVFESLIYFDTNGKIKPRLATSWSFTDENKELTMKLRKNVTFSSGAHFSSKDVVFSLNRNKKTNIAIQDQLRQNFKYIKAIDDYTVKFVFEKPNVQFLYQTCAMLYIISKTDFDKMGEKKFIKNPIGTGPYKFKEWKNGQYIGLVRNENYWGEKPEIKDAIFLFAQDDNTRNNMILAGEADIITNAPWQSIDKFVKKGYNLTKVPTPHAIALTFDLINKNTPWSDVRVRQAINYCIDKDAIVEKICYGVPDKLEWMFEWELGFDPSLKSAYPYNPQKAKELMIEAGYPEGFNMNVIYPSNPPNLSNFKNIVEYIAVSLKQIGINCNLYGLNQATEFFGKINSLHKDPKAEAVVIWEIGGPGNPDPIINLTSQYYSGKKTGLYHTPELDEIIEKGLTTIDNTEREKLIQQAYKIINNDLPVIHILISTNVFISKQNLVYTPSHGTQSTYSILSDTKIN